MSDTQIQFEGANQESIVEQAVQLAKETLNTQGNPEVETPVAEATAAVNDGSNPTEGVESDTQAPTETVDAKETGPTLSLSDVAKQIVDAHKEAIPEIQDYLDAIYRQQQSTYDKALNEATAITKEYEGISKSDLQAVSALSRVHAESPPKAADVLIQQALMWDPNALSRHLPNSAPVHDNTSYGEQLDEWASEGEIKLAKENTDLRRRLESIEQRFTGVDKQTQDQKDIQDFVEFKTSFGRELTRDDVTKVYDYRDQHPTLSIKDAAENVFRNEIIDRKAEQKAKDLAIVNRAKASMPGAPKSVNPNAGATPARPKASDYKTTEEFIAASTQYARQHVLTQ